MDGTIPQHEAAAAIRTALEAGIIRPAVVVTVVVLVAVIVGVIEAEEDHRKATEHFTRRSISAPTPHRMTIQRRIQPLPLLQARRRLGRRWLS